MTSDNLNVTSLEHLNALRAKGEISETDYQTLRDALDCSAPKHEVAPEPTKRLTKSWKNRQLSGVCAGIAERLGTSANLLRLLFVIGFFVSGGGVLLLYIALSLFLPWDEDPNVRTFHAVASYAAKLVICVLLLNVEFYAALGFAHSRAGAGLLFAGLLQVFLAYNRSYYFSLIIQPAIALGIVVMYALASRSYRKAIERGTLWGFLLAIVGILVAVAL